jgi:hypothetical protein
MREGNKDNKELIKNGINTDMLRGFSSTKRSVPTFYYYK